MTRPLSPNNPRPNSIPTLITKGLGYCCEWFFFSHYSDVEMIAARLGVNERTVRKHKKAFKDGLLNCADCPNCMKGKLK